MGGGASATSFAGGADAVGEIGLGLATTAQVADQPWVTGDAAAEAGDGLAGVAQVRLDEGEEVGHHAASVVGWGMGSRG